MVPDLGLGYTTPIGSSVRRNARSDGKDPGTFRAAHGGAVMGFDDEETSERMSKRRMGYP
jgi:hypothetical protein